MDKKREQDFANQEALQLSGYLIRRSPPSPRNGKRRWTGKGAAPRLPEPGTGGTVTKKRRRPIHLHVMVSEEELALIRERMAEAGIRNMGAYMRKMALNGYVLHVDLSDVRELVSLQRRCSNNLTRWRSRPTPTAAFTRKRSQPSSGTMKNYGALSLIC